MTHTNLLPIFSRQGKSRTRFKVGYIDHTGRVVIDSIYDEGTRFYEGFASVRVGTRWGVINTNGEFVITPAARGWCIFREGLATVSVRGTWGIIDASGQFILKPKYAYLDPYGFSEGLAVFSTGEGARARYGYVDMRGVEIIPAVFRKAYRFSEGLAAAQLGDLWGYIDCFGRFKIAPQFSSTRQGRVRLENTRAGRFVNGLAPVWLGQGYGFINKHGEIKIEGPFDDARSFCGDRALVERGRRRGFVEPSGMMTIEARYTHAHDFSEGLAAVAEQESRLGFFPPFGFIDVSGKMVLPPVFQSPQHFEHGLCLVETEDSIGYINSLGEFVWKGAYVDYGVLC